MIPLGQFRDTFILAIDDEGIAIIDQHVAHERVLFEQVMEKLTLGRLESQRLLTPIIIELSAAQRQALAQHAAMLERFGLEIEQFGGDSLWLTAVPALLEPRECEAAVRALAEDLEGARHGLARRGRAAAIAATMACHAAVKANYPLTHGEDALHSRGAAPDRVFERLSARPAGRAADHAARSREEFSADLMPGGGHRLDG